MRFQQLSVSLLVFVFLTGCETTSPAYDYSNFRNADPHSVLVLPPVNNTNEVIATYGVMANLAQPIAESGFYVFPVALVDQTFKSNGLTVAQDIHALPIAKLYEIFGADTALYTVIEDYGTNYIVLASDTSVLVTATLVDLRSGDILWQGAGGASSSENRGGSGGGLVGMLIEAAVLQIMETVTDQSFDIAKIASGRMLSADIHNGLLHGPRSRQYGEPATSEKSK